VWIGFCITVGVSAIYGYSKGQPKKLLAPMDGAGNFCGVDTGFEDYPFIYFPHAT